MKKLSIISVLVLAVVYLGLLLTSEEVPEGLICRTWHTAGPMKPMPVTANLDSHGIHYDKMTRTGHHKKRRIFPFPLSQDKSGDSTNYVLSRQIPNPLPALNTSADEGSRKIIPG